MGGKKERGEKNDEKLIERKREERRKYDREERRSLALPKAWTVGGGEKRRVHFPSFLVRERESTPGGVQPAERGKGRIDAKGHVSERDRATKRSDR